MMKSNAKALEELCKLEPALGEMQKSRFTEKGRRIWKSDADWMKLIEITRLLAQKHAVRETRPYPPPKKTADTMYTIPQYPHERLKP